MKRQTQLRGERYWAGDDLIDLQAEPLKAIDAIFAPYSACVISGCEVSANASRFNVAPGYVSLKGKNHEDKEVSLVVPFAGLTDTVLPIYLTLACETVTDVYGDGAMKPIAYDYHAVAATIKPAAPHLEISATSRVRFIDVVQDDAHRWFTKTLLEKLDGIATGANKYVHPDTPNTRHVSDTQIKKWDPTNSDNLAGKLNNGYMSWVDKNLLEKINKQPYTACAGRVGPVQDAGLVPSGMLTKLLGDFTVELLVSQDSSYTYKVTHKAGRNNLPHINMESGVLDSLVQAPKLLAIDPNYFIVGFMTHNIPATVEGVCFPAAFNFTVEVF